MTDQEIIKVGEANANVSAAIIVIIQDIVLCLAKQPNIDKELLKKHLEAFPGPRGNDVLVVSAY